jgi:hypothetical protein
MAAEIQVYGADWCSLTFGVREYLTNARLGYEYHDVDREPQAEELMLTLPTADGVSRGRRP